MMMYMMWSPIGKVDKVFEAELDNSYSPATRWKDTETKKQGYVRELLQLVPPEMHDDIKKTWFVNEVRPG
jgi:hypothetical protein